MSKKVLTFLSEYPSSGEIGKWLEKQGLERIDYTALSADGPYQRPRPNTCFFNHLSFQDANVGVLICISEPGRLGTRIIGTKEGLRDFQKWVHECINSPIGALLDLQLSRALEIFETEETSDDVLTAEEVTRVGHAQA